MSELFVSPYVQTGGLFWFARMLRKIRLHAEGRLPADYVAYLGRGFDGRCVRFLEVSFEAIQQRALAGGTDEEILEWCFVQRGRRPTENEVLVWNEYMSKRGWRDTDAAPDTLQKYKEHYGLGHRTDILTFFDFYEVDEGRRP